MADDRVITDEPTERRIQEAAQMLLDACLAATPPGETTGVHSEHHHTASIYSLATQALILCDHLKPGTPANEARASVVSPNELKARFFGVGLGSGHVLGTISGIRGTAIAIDALSMGLTTGVECGAKRRPQ